MPLECKHQALIARRSTWDSIQPERRELATYLDGGLKLEEDGLGNEDLTGLGAKITDLRLEKLNLLARAATSHLEKPIDYRVKIDLMLVCHCVRVAWRVFARRDLERGFGG